jgi:FAD/FMN-containing dehydrogenase
MDRREFLRRVACGAAVAALPAGRLSSTRVDPRLAALAKAVRGPVLLQGSAAYESARQVFDSRYAAVLPLAVVQPIDAHDVSAVVRWAAGTGVHIVPKSGGHSYGGYSTTTGVVVDLSRLRAVKLSPGLATVGAGARLGTIYQALAAGGVAIPAGTCPTVGIGGHALGGGFGLASRAWGLACDNVVSVQIVTADGHVLVADARHNSDLYWACRGGGGGNFGIATRFVLRTHRVTHGSYFVATWPWAQAAEVVGSFLGWAPRQPDALGSVCRLATGPGGPTVQVYGQLLGGVATLRSLLADLGPPATRLDLAAASWLDLVRRWADCLGHSLPQCATPTQQAFVGASDYLARVPTSDQLAEFKAAIDDLGTAPGALLIDAYGGVVNRIAPGATAFVHRTELASVQYIAVGADASERAWVDDARAALAPAASGQAYVNYIDPDLRDWDRAYYGTNLPRLRRVKKRYDPHNLFHFPQSIRPA